MVSKKIETTCCDPALEGLAIPASLASSLSSTGGVAGLMRKIPPEVPLEKVARRHQALADPIRLKILWALSEMELCPCVLKVIADVSDSKLTYHLKVLESDKLIKVRRRGNWRMYSITGEGEESLARDGTKHV